MNSIAFPSLPPVPQKLLFGAKIANRFDDHLIAHWNALDGLKPGEKIGTYKDLSQPSKKYIMVLNTLGEPDLDNAIKNNQPGLIISEKQKFSTIA